MRKYILLVGVRPGSVKFGIITLFSQIVIPGKCSVKDYYTYIKCLKLILKVLQIILYN